MKDLLSKKSRTKASTTRLSQDTNLTEKVLRYAKVSSSVFSLPTYTLQVKVSSPARVSSREMNRFDSFVPSSKLPSLQCVFDNKHKQTSRKSTSLFNFSYN